MDLTDYLALPKQERRRRTVSMIVRGETTPLAAAYKPGQDPEREAVLDEAMERRNALPSVLPHADTEEECDRLSAEAETNVAIHLPTFAPSQSTGLTIEPTFPEAKVWSIETFPAPTSDELRRHIARYGREGTAGLLAVTEDATSLARKSEEANLKEIARKRSRRRTGLKEQVAALLQRNPDLMPAAIADALNISDRRAKEILRDLAA